MVAQLGEASICDQCWHLSGGAEKILARAKAMAEGTSEVPVLTMDPWSEALIAGAAGNTDLLHPHDRLVVENGVRWSTLRKIIPRDRLRLAAMVAERVESTPAHTELPAGITAWQTEVIARIAADLDEFRQPRGTKRRRWWRICRVFALCCDRDGRPLTWAAHEVVAEAVGCSTKTVQRCLRWLEGQGLIREVVPGCVLRRSHTAERETEQERADRLAREVVAEAEAIARTAARTPVAAGQRASTGDAGAEEHQDSADVEQVDVRRTRPVWDDNPDEWVHIAAVYELRVPLTELQRAEADRIAAASAPPPPSAGELLAEQHRGLWVHPLNAFLQKDVVLITHDGACGLVASDDPETWFAALNAVTSGNAVKLVRTRSFVHPPQVWNLEEIKSRTENDLWINGRATRDSSTKERSRQGQCDSVHTEATEVKNPQRDVAKKRVKPVPEARQCARWLLNKTLDAVLVEGLDQDFENRLTSLIAGSGLLRHGWTWDDLLDEIHGLPEHQHLPRWIRDPRAWITARITQAKPHLPPSTRQEILAIERTSKWFAEQPEKRREAERAARWAAIQACPLCDNNGLLDLPGAPVVRCNHDPDSGGW